MPERMAPSKGGAEWSQHTHAWGGPARSGESWTPASRLVRFLYKGAPGATPPTVRSCCDGTRPRIDIWWRRGQVDTGVVECRGSRAWTAGGCRVQGPIARVSGPVIAHARAPWPVPSQPLRPAEPAPGDWPNQGLHPQPLRPQACREEASKVATCCPVMTSRCPVRGSDLPRRTVHLLFSR